MAFDPDKYLNTKGVASEEEKGTETSSGFNPDNYLTAKNIPIEDPVEGIEKMSPEMAALNKATQGMSFGFGDELAGGMDAFGRVIGVEGLGSGDIANVGLAEGGPTLDLETLKDTYRQGRDTERAKMQKAETDQPKAALAGDIAGSLIAPIPGLGAAKTLGKAGSLMDRYKKLSKAKQAMTTGAAAGGIESLGRTEEDTALGMAEDTAGGVLGGGVLGGIVGKVGSKFSKEGVEKIAKEAPKEANIAALKAAGAGKKDIKREFGFNTNKRASSDTAKGTGQTLLDEDLLKVRQSPTELKDAMVNRLDEVVQKRMNPTISKLDTATQNVKPKDLTNQFKGFTDRMRDTMENTVGGSTYAEEASGRVYKNMVNTSKNVFDDVQEALKGPDKFKRLLEIKRKLQKEVDWNNPDKSAYNQFLIQTQGNVSGLMNDIAKKSSTELGEQMAKNNKTYANLISGNDIAGNEMARDLLSGTKVGIGEYVAAGVISNLSDNAAAGPLAIGSKKLLEKVTGKDLSKTVDTFTALRKNAQGKKASEALKNYAEGSFKDVMSKGSDTLAGGAVAASAALVDDTNTMEPYKKDRVAADYIKTASPEAIMSESARIRSKYGKSGEQLASNLEKISQRDQQGRNALMFSILQNPNNREMLGLVEGE